MYVVSVNVNVMSFTKTKSHCFSLQIWKKELSQIPAKTASEQDYTGWGDRGWEITCKQWVFAGWTGEACQHLHCQPALYHFRSINLISTKTNWIFLI